jgi:hypothetical protein
LLGTKFPKAVLRLSSCNINLFFKLLDNALTSKGQYLDFKKILNYLFETVRGVLIYAKDGKCDLLFKEEQLIESMGKIIKVCFIDNAENIMKLTSQVINKKEIGNDDMMYELMNFTIGSIKCFNQTN